MDVYNMDDIKLEIYSEGDHCNFSPWMEEKITNILNKGIFIPPELLKPLQQGYQLNLYLQ